jgi:hypothetical protein
MAASAKGAGRGERVVLFTLVDLLVQIIFFALFLLVLLQQSHPELPASVERALIPYTKVAKAQLVEFIDAVSRMVPLSSIDKARSIGDQDRGIRDRLAAISKLMRAVSGLPSPEVESLARFLSDPGNARRLRQLVSILAREPKSSLSPSDVKRFAQLRRVYIAMSPSQRTALVAQAIAIIKPRCFNGRAAFAALAVQGGYILSNPISDVVPVIRSALGRPGSGPAAISEGDLDTLGNALTGRYPDCNIYVGESSETNSRSQYKHLNHYFLLDQ